MAATCGVCGDTGHLAAGCPVADEVLDTRPPWCGYCDQRTRLATVDLERGTVRKCPHCHPAAQKRPDQHRRCGGCGTVVYRWDTGDCGSHTEIGKRLECTRKECRCHEAAKSE